MPGIGQPFHPVFQDGSPHFARKKVKTPRELTRSAQLLRTVLKNAPYNR